MTSPSNATVMIDGSLVRLEKRARRARDIGGA
jgi:hypothetical protein